MAPSKKSTSMDMVYEKIIEKIISEQLPPGTPLREERLAVEFGVSSTPVREAFRRLEYEGWIQSRPYHGSFTRKFSAQDIDELYQLREMLEGLAAAAAAIWAASFVPSAPLRAAAVITILVCLLFLLRVLSKEDVAWVKGLVFQK